MYICVCNGITEREVRACVEEGVHALHELEQRLGVGAGCGRCKSAVEEILDASRPRPHSIRMRTPAARAPGPR